VTSRLQQLEQENKDLKKVTDDLRSLVLSLESRVKSLESSKPGAAVQAPKPSAPQPAPPAKAAAKPDDDDDDDVDLFGSDEEDEDAERIKQERVAAYAAKKSTSNIIIYFLIIVSYYVSFSLTEPALIAKSNIILDVKPWDDETDMAEMERRVREITSDGLLWGTCKSNQSVSTLSSAMFNFYLICSQVGSTGIWNQETPDFHSRRR
jgi:elongation factor 1-delta